MLEVKTKELFSNLEELINMALKQTMDLNTISSIEPDELEAIKLAKLSMDEAKNLCIEMAKKLDKIDNIDRNIEKLLSMQKRNKES